MTFSAHAQTIVPTMADVRLLYMVKGVPRGEIRPRTDSAMINRRLTGFGNVILNCFSAAVSGIGQYEEKSVIRHTGETAR